jgi:hypothetical protein
MFSHWRISNGLFLGSTLSLCLAAQGPLDAVLKKARQQGLPWVLVHRPEDAASFERQDDDLLRLRSEGQLSVIPLEPQSAGELWQARGWGAQSHWLLVSVRGEEAGDGLGVPKGEAILGLLRERGLKPRWEERRAFLKENPGNGEAWSDEVMKAARLARLRMKRLMAHGKAVRGSSHLLGREMPATVLADPNPEVREAQADEVFEELAAALQGAQGVEGWWKGIVDVSMLFPSMGASDSPRMRKVCHSLAEDLEQALLHRGPELGLDSRWISFRAMAGQPVKLLPEFVSLPGEPGPSATILMACISNLVAEKDWEGALSMLDRFSDQKLQEPWTPETWDGWCFYQSFLAGLRIRPLWELGRKEEAKTAAETMRAWAGTEWPEIGNDAFFVGSKIQEESFFQDMLLKPPLPKQPMPAQRGAVRIALMGEPSWRADWEALRESRSLLSWAPGELQWVRLNEEEAQRLRNLNTWGPEPRWALLRDSELLLTGWQCPNPETLASVLEKEQPSRLRRLNELLDRNPGHLGLRRRRMALLKARMPEPRLEELLAEDARATFEPENMGLTPLLLDFGPDASWKPDPRLWQWSAQQVLPRLESLLRAWPSHPGFWKAWLAWARFHPSRPSVVSFAGTLSLWQSRDQWIGALPPEVHRTVATELRADKNYPEIVRWLEDAWRGVDKTPAAKVDPDTWSYLKPEREKLREGIVTPLAESLRMLKRDPVARAVEAAYKAMMIR